MIPLADLKAVVERHFRVYDVRDEKVSGETVAALFYVMFPDGLGTRYEAVRQQVAALDPDLVVFLRRDGGEDILFVAARPPAAPQRTRLHAVLLALTVATTVTSGALFWQGYRHWDAKPTWSVLWSPEHLLYGALTFALPLMLILGLHELAHYVAARRYGLRATLPFFIPVPPGLTPLSLGTFGAFINLKDPLPDRKALFDVGAAGPIAGFLVAVPILLLGAHLTGVEAVEVPDQDRPELALDVPHDADASRTGRTVLTLAGAEARAGVLAITAPSDADGAWSYEGSAEVRLANGTRLHDRFAGRLDPGESVRRPILVPANATLAEVRVTWDDHLIEFGDPLLWAALDWAWFDNDDYLTHPTFIAGWVGLLVTGINLVPASQLDGGHVARAVLGERMRYAALAAVAGLLFLAFWFNSWVLMALFVLLMGVQHPPPLNDHSPLGTRRMVFAAVVLLVFVLTFVPRPLVG